MPNPELMCVDPKSNKQNHLATDFTEKDVQGEHYVVALGVMFFPVVLIVDQDYTQDASSFEKDAKQEYLSEHSSRFRPTLRIHSDPSVKLSQHSDDNDGIENKHQCRLCDHYRFHFVTVCRLVLVVTVN
jgi:hypothetical protein